jgi:hypothetical protein
MNRIISLLVLITISASTLFSQTNIPQLVSFSAVVRDANNIPLISTAVFVQLTFKEGGQNGNDVYCALHETTTNQNGFMSIQLNRELLGIGCNGAPTNSFEEINWQNGGFWMVVEYKTSPGSDFINLGQLELASSFYAFAAKTAESINGVELSGANDGDVLTYNLNSGKWEPMPSGTGFTNSGLNVIPRIATKGQQLSVSFSGSNNFLFSNATSVSPQVLLNFNNGSSTSSIYSYGTNYINDKRIDAVFQIPWHAATGTYDVIISPFTPAPQILEEFFKIF